MSDKKEIDGWAGAALLQAQAVDAACARERELMYRLGLLAYSAEHPAWSPEEQGQRRAHVRAFAREVHRVRCVDAEVLHGHRDVLCEYAAAEGVVTDDMREDIKVARRRWADPAFDRLASETVRALLDKEDGDG